MKSPNSILLFITFVGAGEYVLSLPSISALKNKFKNLKLVAVIRTDARFKELVENTKELDEVIFIRHKGLSIIQQYNFLKKLYKQHFDTAILYTGSSRFLLYAYLSGIKKRIGFANSDKSFLLTDKVPFAPTLHRVVQYFKLLGPIGINLENWECEKSNDITKNGLDGVSAVDYKSSYNMVGQAQCPVPTVTTKMNIPLEHKNFADNFIKENKIDLDASVLIGIFPGAQEEKRRWNINNFAELINKLINAYNNKILILSGPSEVNLVNDLKHLLERSGNAQYVYFANPHISLLQLAALIEKCSLFISNDTSAMHIAANLRVPVVALQKPENINNYSPWSDNSIVITKKMPCENECSKIKCNTECIQMISVDIVYKVCKQIIEGSTIENKIVYA